MRRVCALLLLLATASAHAAACAPDAVPVGALCVDRWEASVWAIARADAPLLDRMRAGTATVDELRDAGAVQVGCGGRMFGLTAAAAVRDRMLVAQSLPGVLPSTCITWVDAARACEQAGKRLLTLNEWHAAAAGTPRDACNVSGPPFGMAATGSHERCVSTAGAYDLPGNVEEWVDLAPLAPDARIRTGRAWYARAADLQFAATRPLSPATGFRCGRPS